MNDTFTHTEEDAAIVEEAEKVVERPQSLSDINSIVSKASEETIEAVYQLMRDDPVLTDLPFRTKARVLDKVQRVSTAGIKDAYLLGARHNQQKFDGQSAEVVATIHPDGTQTK